MTEFGAADASCGFWNGTEESCEKYWSEGHIEAAFEAVLSAVRDWNADHDGLYRGVYVLDSPTDSGLFGLASSEDVQLAVQEGLAELE